MVSELGKCDVCNGKLILTGKKEVAGTRYNILKCEKCNKQVVKHQD